MTQRLTFRRSVALFCGSWGIRSNWLGDWHERVSPISKFFAILFPSIIVGLSHAPAVLRHTGVFFVVTNITSNIPPPLPRASTQQLTISSARESDNRQCTPRSNPLQIHENSPFVSRSRKTRRLVGIRRIKRAKSESRSRYWGRGDYRVGRDFEHTAIDIRPSAGDSIYGWFCDPCVRPPSRSIVESHQANSFVISIFEVAIIIFDIFQQGNNKSIALSGAPNHSVSNTISDILFFIPGVTASLVVFLVFGTTKSWRQYRDLVVGGCGIRTKIYERRIQRASATPPPGLEFERLPSLPNRPSEDNAIKVERRVRMFVTSMPQEPQGHNPQVSTAVTAAESSNTGRPAKIEFHKPRFVDMAMSVPPSPRPDAGLAVSPIDLTWPVSQDPVIQYGAVEDERRPTETNMNITNLGKPQDRDERRFVSERLPKNDQEDFLSDSSS